MSLIGDTLSKIDTNSVPGAAIFQSYKRGEIDFDGWVTAEAIRFLDSTSGIVAWQPNELSHSLREYCRGRLDGRMSYDYSVAKKLGDWFCELRRTIERNEERKSMFLWAKEKTGNKNLTDYVRKAELALLSLERAKYDLDAIDLVLKVTAIDSDARERLKK